MTYQIWLTARDSATLVGVAEALVFEHADRLIAENFNEHAVPREMAAEIFGPMVLARSLLFICETRSAPADQDSVRRFWPVQVPRYAAVAHDYVYQHHTHAVNSRCKCHGPKKLRGAHCAACHLPI